MKILLGVCGGVAAYKAAELTRELQRRDAEVQVVMTAGAERFITPLTFAALSGRQVLTSLWGPETGERAAEEPGPFDIEHIRIAQQAECLVIAPATANMIAKLAHGMADDLLTTLVLATTAPVVLAPAMNVNMWNHPATQANLATLRSRAVQVVEPNSGMLACGMVGAGRLAEPSDIADVVIASARPAPHRQPNDLAGKTVLITAGGTREPIDAVRFLTNRSSGKMGFALAEAASSRGAHVILISTVPDRLTPEAWEHVRVSTAAEMQQACLAHLARASIVIMAAAVSDYRLLNPTSTKRKKTPTLTLELIQNDDILQQLVCHRRPGTLVVGFAAETEHVLEAGRRKLHSKGVDAIVVNDVSQSGSGFEANDNAGVLLTRDREIVLPLSSKRQMADRILDQLSSLSAGHPSTVPSETNDRSTLSL